MARRKKNIRSLDKEVGRPSGNLGQMKESRRKRSQQPAKFSNYVFKVLKQVHPQVRYIRFFSLIHGDQILLIINCVSLFDFQ